MRFAHTGANDDGFNGTWIRDGTDLTSDGGAEEVYVLVSGSDTIPSGDLCATFDLDGGACGGGGLAGTFRITGAQDVLVTFDEVTCDGCATITVDGVDAGKVCFED